MKDADSDKENARIFMVSSLLFGRKIWQKIPDKSSTEALSGLKFAVDVQLTRRQGDFLSFSLFLIVYLPFLFNYCHVLLLA